MAGKKKATVEHEPAVAAPTVPAASSLSALRAQMKGVAKETKKEGKSSTPEVPLSDASMKKDIRAYLVAAAREKAACGQKESIGDRIRGPAKELYISFCRQSSIYHKVICLGSEMNFGSIQLKVAKPNAKSGTTVQSIEDGLRELFGADFDKYYSIAPSIALKPEKVTPEVVTLLKSKLGDAAFNDLFVYNEDLGLTEAGGAEDKIVLLKRDATMNPVAAAKVSQAIEKFLLTENMGSLTPQKTALALAEEEILAEEQAKAGVEVKAS